MTKANVLVFAGSLRSGSFNARLADLAGLRLEEESVNVARLDLCDHPLPVYDADLEVRQGLPVAAVALHERFRSHGGIFIASPE